MHIYMYIRTYMRRTLDIYRQRNDLDALPAALRPPPPKTHAQPPQCLPTPPLHAPHPPILIPSGRVFSTTYRSRGSHMVEFDPFIESQLESRD